MVPPWCHGVGGVWGRHGEVAVVFLLQIAVGATWGGSGAPGKQVFHGSGHIARGQLGICRGDCGVVKRSHRSRTVRTRRSGYGVVGALIARGRLGPAGVVCGGRGAAHRSRSVWVLPRRLWIRGEVTSHKISSEPAKTTAEAESGSGIPFGAAHPGLLRHHPCGSGSG